MIMSSRNGSERWRGRPERTASARQCSQATAVGITEVRPRTPGTLGIPGDQVRMPRDEAACVPS